ncbi:CLUMA_CG012349, isoform A [Clunio marinus]|uniref:CLUMA_CG012349, isoform A n=1 Tax=Clunio marinus TaxID=568069 RepID=A0A1J1IGK3_9DIPT|nr:CLUMA_CG012349, isoform A [Clunio marinus]
MKIILKTILIGALIAICSAYQNEKCVTIPPVYPLKLKIIFKFFPFMKTEESPETPETSPETPDTSPETPTCSDQCPIRDEQISVLMREISTEREKMINGLGELLKPDEKESFQNWLTNTTDVDEYLLPIGIDEGLTQLIMPVPVWFPLVSRTNIMREKVDEIKNIIKKIWLDLYCKPCPAVYYVIKRMMRMENSCTGFSKEQP